MRRSGVGSGGGYGMNKHRDVRAPKAEPRPRAVHPGGVAQLGNKQDKIAHIEAIRSIAAKAIKRLSVQPTTSQRLASAADAKSTLRAVKE